MLRMGNEYCGVKKEQLSLEDGKVTLRLKSYILFPHPKIHGFWKKLWTAENVIIRCRNARFGDWKLCFGKIVIWSLYSSVWDLAPKVPIGQSCGPQKTILFAVEIAVLGIGNYVLGTSRFGVCIVAFGLGPPNVLLEKVVDRRKRYYNLFVVEIAVFLLDFRLF